MLFLGIFSGSEYIASLTNVYEINLYALFTFPIFLVLLTYSIVEQHSLGFKGDSFTLAKLLFSIFSLVALFNLVLADDPYELGVTAASTVVTAGFGLLLLRSAHREVKQREQIEQLAQGLEIANDQLKVLDKMKSEFVSIASHQLRSPLTAIRGYASMLIEGSFGPVPDKAKDAVERIAEASRFMASSVEDYLNVSRIQAGNMKYEYSDFNLRDLASRVADDTRQIAMKKGLLLTFKTDMHKTGIVHADIGKTRQIIDNLINNSLKYTPKGSIEVLVRDEEKTKKIFVEIKDTGIGMSSKTIENIFGKFKRAENANEVNVTGTGLGLYIAKKMAQEMKGDVTAYSDGEGKGSLFRIELPLMM
jgi:signal transduction histidine kinase